MKLLYPDYENCLANVTSSIQNYFGVKNNIETNKILDEILKNNKNKKVIYVLFDGLGLNILKRNEKYCPILNKYIKASVSSNFPSTTMSSRTTIESGLYPVTHGWVGWNMYFKGFDKVITLAYNYVKDTKEIITDYNIGKTLLKYKSTEELINENKIYSADKVSYYVNKKMSLRKKIKDVIKSIKKNNFVYFYLNDPDYTFHKYGVDSRKSIKSLKKMEYTFKKLINKVSDATIILVADHGHLNVEYITLSDYPKIVDMLDNNISIDVRACSFKAKEGYKKEFLYEIKKVLKDDFVILTKEELIEKKLYGPGIENKYFKDAIGDYIAIGVTNKAIRLDERTHAHKSTHSGITEDEMIVPLIVYGGNNE